MKKPGVLPIVLLSCFVCHAERVMFLGFDVSGTAFAADGQYDAPWTKLLKTVEGGDHVYATVINEKGLANGAPAIEFTIRPYNFLSDKRSEYDAAVQAKLAMQRAALSKILKDAKPSKKTEIIGFLHAASHVLGAYPSKTTKQIVLWTDGLQEGDQVDLARMNLTDADISKVIETERQAGRLPTLSGISVWFVTSPSVESGQLTTAKLLRLEAFWSKYIQACGGQLKGIQPCARKLRRAHVCVGQSHILATK